MTIKPDGIQFASFLPNYIQIIPNPTSSLDISGIFPDTFSYTFSTTITGLSPNKTRCDVYGTNLNTGYRQLLTNSHFPAIYQNKAGEKVRCFITFGTNSVTFNLFIDNVTGAPVTLIDQTIAISVVQYKIPF
jgi:hypothetical protein